MSDLVCPYCQEFNDAPDDRYTQDERYQTECSHCEKNFVYTLSYSITYHEAKADCLNGGEHKYEPICGYPEYIYKNRRRCSDCADEIVLKEGHPDYVEVKDDNK